ncbi:uncharacterized protein LOC128182975 [Crassostrea angulata]|uniref:uncharacterized protein LOC128182975 n=1 Tax=Magallana angulata TaxID=2784310 RepID=UPI0022B20ECE|nr:uncharacterized protein LOC128182975 [Crassostrea angulata]
MKYGSKVLQEKIQHELLNSPGLKTFLEEEKHSIFHLTLPNSYQCCLCDLPDENNKYVTFQQNSTKLAREFLKVMYYKKKIFCTNRALNVLCCCCLVPDHNVDIRTWDVTLTSSILLDILLKDCQSDQNDIVDLREIRNSTLHKGNALLSGDKYIETFKNASEKIKSIAKKCGDNFYQMICDDINKLERNRLYPWELKEAQEHWREAKNTLVSFSNTLNGVASKVEIEFKNIESYSKQCLRKNVKYLQPVIAMNRSLKLLQDNKCIFITGDAGCGKTSFCLGLMSRMEEEHCDSQALILRDTCDLKKLNNAKNYILFIDDIVDKSDADVNRFESWSANFDYLKELISNESTFIILASRNGVWHAMRDKFVNYDMFKLDSSNAPVIDLSGEDYKMSPNEKIKLLNFFRERNRLNHKICPSEKTIKSIAEMDTPPGFLLLCNEFFSDILSLQQGTKYFKVTACSRIKNQVDRLLINNQYLHYGILVSVFLNYSLYNKDIGYTYRDIEKGIDTRIVKAKELIPSKIKSCLEGILKTFIESSDNVYRFKHLTIYEAVLLSFRENYPEVFTELIPKEVLYNYVRTENYTAKNHEVIVRFPFEMLAWKLVKLCKANAENSYPDAHAHPSFHDKELVRHFLNEVSGYKNEMLSYETNDICKFNFQFFISVIKIYILDTFRHLSNKNQLKNIFVTKFLNPFVTGACEEKNDYLASETIKKFFDIYEFGFDVFEIVIKNDLIYTCQQFLNNKLFKKLYNKKSSDYITKVTTYGAKKCLRHMEELHNKKTNETAYFLF